MITFATSTTDQIFTNMLQSTTLSNIHQLVCNILSIKLSSVLEFCWLLPGIWSEKVMPVQIPQIYF